ncbi:uncharacterized protein LOC126795202 [Argentina anserina]|uniref:uncharacterized protein LOC126795202 n=1 Tax=Argentina anserina TaxID=57926 RepID=UPI0021762E60|nr:uncharacterized protein LOC126795202 [Potentilla anserina]
MDLDEWEYLPDDAFLDFHEENEKKVLFSKRYFDSKSVFNTYHDYYIVQSPNSSTSKKLNQVDHPAVPPKQLAVPVQLQLLPPPIFVRSTQTPYHEGKQETLVPFSAAGADVTGTRERGGGGEGDQDPLLSQVYFKKTSWEPESVDMKMDSPRSPTRAGFGFGFVHQTTSDSTAGGAKFQFDECNGEAKVSSPRMKTKNKEEEKEDDDQGKRENNNNIWKMSLTGIGAICSFGFAAATICILFLGSHHQSNKQNHKHFQIYTDDNKSIQEVVHRATKFNETYTAVRGVPLSRAHITSGGYYTSAL